MGFKYERWDVAPAVPAEEAFVFGEEVPRAIAGLLWNRGVKNKQDAERFFVPDWETHLHSPLLFSRMNEAVARVFVALEQGEPVTIHGDYDADGVCGTTVLYTTLREILRAMKRDVNVLSSYIPHREKEGYGMAVKTVDVLRAAYDTKLIITVDCGISNKEAIEYAKTFGIDTIVCDHHTMPEQIPYSAILLHPLVPGETYPNPSLCGTGVAFKLACALFDEARKRGLGFPQGAEKWLLDLVAIATVTDVVPLHGENRLLETYGLKVLQKTRRVGLRKLGEIAGVDWSKVDTTTIGFQFGPRLNAAGRMEHADVALRLLLCEDETLAHSYALELQELNKARQVVSERMYEEAREIVGNDPQDPVLVVMKQGWSPGLVGLVASKLVNEFYRPAYVIGNEGTLCTGSGRSVPGFHVTEALHAAKEHLVRFGGHPQACGFSFEGSDRFEAVRGALIGYANRDTDANVPASVRFPPTLRLHGEVILEEVNWTLIDWLQKMAPFGERNPKPVFLVPRAKVILAEPMGATGDHVRLLLQAENGVHVKAVAFRFAQFLPQILGQTRLDLACEVDVNEWQGRRELQLKIQDVRTS